MATMAKAINPELKITKFADGVTKDNLKEFFTGVDLYVDGLDFCNWPGPAGRPGLILFS